MTIQGPAIANLIIEVIGIMLSVFGLIIIRYGSVSDSRTIKQMMAAIISMLLYNSSLFYLEISQAVSLAEVTTNCEKSAEPIVVKKSL